MIASSNISVGLFRGLFAFSATNVPSVVAGAAVLITCVGAIWLIHKAIHKSNTAV